jgi:hypothetical protein
VGAEEVTGDSASAVVPDDVESSPGDSPSPDESDVGV